MDESATSVRMTVVSLGVSDLEAFWGGYSGYFADPDGYPWEIAYNPHWKLDAEGRVVLPK
jgi:hypothetical protein